MIKYIKVGIVKYVQRNYHIKPNRVVVRGLVVVMRRTSKSSLALGRSSAGIVFCFEGMLGTIRGTRRDGLTKSNAS